MHHTSRGPRRPRLAAALLPAAMLLTLPGIARAQSAQPFAVQLSGLVTTAEAAGKRVAGFGVELQQRFNRVYASETFGAASIGIGMQYTVHTRAQDKLKITGVFIEPRWVPPTGSSQVFPYLSARVVVQRLRGEFQFAEEGSTNGSMIGLGGGLAVKLSRIANVDAGVQLVRQQFGSLGVLNFTPYMTYAAKVGISLGYPR
ncbi:MAG: hypothetical protein IT355_02655 [Gemmatimonadaceae bacterium]|nr:hypothetical protein [Gemmatimonadaceae bacterium]